MITIPTYKLAKPFDFVREFKELQKAVKQLQVSSGNIAAGTISGLSPAAAFHGLNMITDPQFTLSALNALRLNDSATSSGWTISGGTAVCPATSPASQLALMPSTGIWMWVNPGEQYYLSVTATTTASMQVGIEIVTNAGVVSTSATFSGTQTVSGTVTIPAGASTGYVQVFVSGSSATATLSNPVCQPATLNSPTIVGGQIIGDGIGNEVLLYKGTPAHGNMIASISSLTDSDDFTNSVLDGIASYGPGGGKAQLAANQTTGVPYLILFPTNSVHAGTEPQIFGSNNNAGAVNEYEILVLHSGKTSQTGWAELDLISEANDGSSVAIFFFFVNGNLVLVVGPTSHRTAVPIKATQPGTSNDEAWHAITLDTGWATDSTYDVPQYRLLPDGNLQFRGRAHFSFTSSAGVNLNNSNPLPSAYWSTNSHDWRYGDLVGSRCHVSINGSGVVKAIPPNGATFTNTYYAELDGIIPIP